MNSNKFWRLAFVLGSLTLISLNCAAQESPIVDQAALSPEVRRKLISEYEVSRKTFVDDRLLAVAVSYAKETNYALAIIVYQDVLKQQPNQKRALRGLGLLYFVQQKYETSLLYLKKAWSLGDADSLVPVAASYLKTGQWSEFEGLLPELLKRKSDDEDAIKCILGFALSKNPPREDLIEEALEALPDKDIAATEDMAGLVGSAAERLKALDENNKTVKMIDRKIIRAYESDPNIWPKVSMSGVAGAYFDLDDYVTAEKISQQALVKQPNDVGALAVLGAVYWTQRKFPDAIYNYRRAWSLGHKQILPHLADAYVASHDLDGMKDLIPSLLEIKGENLECLNSILVYALGRNPMNKELFYKAIQGISDDQILRRPDTTDTVVKGLKFFGDDEHAKLLLKLKAQQDKGIGV